MKKIAILFCIFLLVFCTIITPNVIADDNQGVVVYLDGKRLSFDVPPMIIEGRTMVPMRKIFEEIGAAVQWEQSSQTASANKGDIAISIQIDNNIMNVSGKEIVLDVPAQIINDRTLVPARAVSEAFGAYVDWSDKHRAVIINTENIAMYKDFPNVIDYGLYTGATLKDVYNIGKTIRYAYYFDGDKQKTLDYMDLFERSGYTLVDGMETEITIGLEYQSNSAPATTVCFSLNADENRKIKEVQIEISVNGEYNTSNIEDFYGPIINIYEKLDEGGLYLYQDANGNKFVRYDDVRTWCLDYPDYLFMFLLINEGNDWAVQKYDGVNDTKTIIASGVLYEIDGEKYIKAQTFLDIIYPSVK